MSTVPKLNYAKLRNNSKNKNSQHLTSHKQESQENNLFSHMNKDNLNYIQSQIKQKNKKNPHQRAKSSMQNMEEQRPKINKVSDNKKKDELQCSQQKQSKIQQQNDSKMQAKCLKTTQNESNQQKDKKQGPRKISKENNCEDQQQDGKLSYYQIASNVKSKRVTSLEASVESNNQIKQSQFINFLQEYVQKLCKNSKITPKDTAIDVQLGSHMTISHNLSRPTVYHEDEYMIQKIQHEKQENVNLARQLQRYKRNDQINKNRIAKLEQQMNFLMDQVVRLNKRVHENNNCFQTQKTYRQQQNVRFANPSNARQNIISHQKMHLKRNVDASQGNSSINSSQKVRQKTSLEKLEAQFLRYKKQGIKGIQIRMNDSNYRL